MPNGLPRYELAVVRVFVTDQAKALAFYAETLGMPIAHADAEIGWAELETGAVRLAIERVDPADAEASALVGRFVGISLRVEDLRGTHESLTSRGVDFVAPPERQPWGGSLAHFRDPDGNVLTLMES